MSDETKRAPDFRARMIEAVESSVLALLRKGEWLTIDYASRVKVDLPFLRDVYAGLDLGRIQRLVSERVEERIADAILNAMATEVANDTKQIMSNRELREDVRALLREKIRSSAAALSNAKEHP